ncbi:MAG: dihydroorotase family protein, partial [Candidatus Kerfeldbacteria bacterium]|nr:dihydroorotase family protein [Candidatus Kerfeldbacteria bacterium]
MRIIRRATHFATGKPVDVAMDNGTITAVGSVHGTGDEIDAAGLTVMPGFIDPHVHFRTPGDTHKEDWTTGSRAAARGGFTTVLDMPNTKPPLTDPETLHAKRQLARASVVNYGFHFALTRDNIDTLDQMGEVRTVKLFLGQSTGNLLVDDALLDDAFVRLPEALFLIHAESEHCLASRRAAFTGMPAPADHSTLRDRRCAVEAVERVLELVRIHQRPVYFCHVSTAEEVDLVRQAKEEGLPVFAEVTPHHLFLDDSAYAALGMLAKVNPPLRTSHDRTVLLEALEDGIIDTIGTDHAPHLRSEKDQPYDQAPAGFPGLETAAPLLLQAVHDGVLPLTRVVEAMSTRPAEIFGLSRKGRLEEGADADLVLVDVRRSQRVCHEDLAT